MSSWAPLSLLTELCRVTEAQLRAARTLDGERLAALNQERSDLLFDLQVAMQDELPTDPVLRQQAADQARQLTLLEYRLRAVAGSVNHILEQVLPRSPAPTYGRSGRVG